MAEEKRVKLGVDVGALSNELLQVNKLVEDNYQKAIKGQNEYNKVLKESLELFEEQTKFLEQMSSNGGQNQLMPSMPIMPMQGMGDSSNSILSDIKDILDEIADYFLGNNRGNLGGVPGGGNNQNANAVDDQGNPVVTSFVNVPNSGSAGGIFNSVASTASSVDPNALLVGAAAMIPVVGMGVAKIVGSLLEAATKRDEAIHTYRAISGGLGQQFGGLNEIGLSEAATLEKQAAYYRQNINLQSKDLYFEKGFGLSSGTLGSLLASTRQDIDISQGASVLGASFLRSLQTGGLIDSKSVRGYSEEYLKILVDLNQKQLAITGETNSTLNTNIVTKMASLDQHFGDPTMLANMMQGFQKGFSSAGTPQMEALQYYAMKQANPEASLWDMQMIKENPFGKEAQGYAGRFLNLLSKTGSNDDFKFNLMNQFGWTAHQTEYFVNGINRAKQNQEFQDENGNFDFGKYFASMQNNQQFQKAGQWINEEAGAATSETQVNRARKEDFMADLGTPLLSTLNTINDRIYDAIDWFKQGKVTEKIESILDDIAENHRKGLQMQEENREVLREAIAQEEGKGTIGGKIWAFLIQGALQGTYDK